MFVEIAISIKRTHPPKVTLETSPTKKIVNILNLQSIFYYDTEQINANPLIFCGYIFRPAFGVRAPKGWSKYTTIHCIIASAEV